jgi:hypothetical protein
LHAFKLKLVENILARDDGDAVLGKTARISDTWHGMKAVFPWEREALSNLYFVSQF